LRGALALVQLCAGPGLVLACASSPLAPEGDRLRHAAGEFTLPDLAREGWQRVRVRDADAAFRHSSGATIAVRSRCPVEPPVSLEWRARELYHGTPAERREERSLEVNGLPAYEILASVDGLRLHTVVVWSGSCLVDLALATRDSAGEASFAAFVAGFRGRTPQ
jgi:hypothetical protein